MNISLTKAYDYHFIHNIAIRMNEWMLCHWMLPEQQEWHFEIPQIFQESSAVSMCQLLVMLKLWQNHLSVY